jgi:DNA polymerase-3 subunit beta
LNNLLIATEPVSGSISISATDLEIYLKKESILPGLTKNLAAERVILPGRKLLELTREVQGDLIEISSSENRILIQAGPTRAVLSGLDPAEYPEPPEFPSQVSFKFSSSLLDELFESSVFAVSRDESRPAMCGVFWELKPGELRMVATDGYRLALVKRLGGPVPTEAQPFKVIVPAKVFNHLPDGEQELAVSLDPQKIGFKFNQTTLIARLIEGPYPDYDRVIPAPSEKHLIVGTDSLAAGLRRVALFADTATRTIHFRLSNDSLKLYAATPDLGEATEELSCSYSGDEMEIGYNASYLLDILRHIDSDEVVFELTTQRAAALIRPKTPKEGIEKLFLLMPIRLD